jgi:transcriptional regulator with GAF, ATPase, and Fis domain/serine/threonine protein kinase/Tfp pilus assembly protein PilF
MSRYDIASILAEGAQGKVYRATDRITGQNCVLKTGETVHSEALVALQLSHPYIAAPFDAGSDSTLGKFVAYPEYTETPLLEWLRTSNSSDLQRIALQIAEFLAFLHRRGWLYHDFKPEHFLVARQSIRVLDLGLAQQIQQTSQTFSGTFPYIAPERLAGRKCDARSDIFALGMLLLHALSPDEPWDFDPSIEVLQDLQKRTRKLPGFWKDLLNEMISLEPAQRIESASELWKRLLPHNVRGSFLIFPIPAYFQVPENFLNNKPIVTFQTASSLNVSEIERITLQQSWNQGIQTATFDFRHSTPEDVLRTVCWAQLNQQPKDLFSAIESLQKATNLQPYTILLRSPEALNPSQRSMLAYSLSALQNIPPLHFVLLGAKQSVEVPEESSTRIEVPLLTKQNLSEVVPFAFPAEGLKQDRIDKIRAKGYALPEQVLADLRKELPQDSFLIWPAAARDLAPAAALERLRATDMRILGSLALAATPLSKSWLFQALRLPESQGNEWLDNLQARGYVQIQNDLVSLVMTAQTILERLRKDRVAQIASSLLANAPLDGDPEILYRIARASRNKKIAAFQALRAASKFPERSDAAQEWYWYAFLAGAELPKQNLYRLVNSSLRTARHKRTRRVLNSIRSRFGYSFRLASSWLDFYLRTADFSRGEKLSSKLIKLSESNGKKKWKEFFRIKKTGFLVRQNRFDEAEEIFSDLRNSPTIRDENKLLGLLDHYFGLWCFYKGRFDEAINVTWRAIRTGHSERSTSIMNLGAFLMRIGKFKAAENWLNRAVRVYQKECDAARLAYAHNNMGVLLKQRGKIQEARENYFKCLQLSRVEKNFNLTISALTNLGLTYEIEGRIKRALNQAEIAIKIARSLNLQRELASALAQAGREYAIIGKYSNSISSLKEALKIHDHLKATSEIALTSEALGVAYSLSGHGRDAVMHLNRAHDLYTKAGAHLDSKRTLLWMALAHQDIASISTIEMELPEESFEKGLFHYLIATDLLKTSDVDDTKLKDHLHNAERIFRGIPSLFWLGKILKLKADYFFKKDHFEKGSNNLESAYNIFSRLGATKELLSLNSLNAQMKTPSDLINKMAEGLPYKVLTMVREVLSEGNPDRMINQILSSSLEFTDMERAVLILAEDPPRIFKSATLDDSAVQEIYEISQSALEEATDLQKPYVRLNAVSDPYLKGKPSILASRIMSIVCLPLKVGDRFTGVLYLDSREGIETLAKTETVLLEIFASIIGIALNNSLVLEQSLVENETLRASLNLVNFPEIIGKSDSIIKVLQTVQNLLPTDLAVLITGETGTGKELIARVLHFSGKRKNGPFLAVNCSALTKTLLESELFGHEKGSFTGAIQQKKGLFEQAKQGTLFLDEVGEMPPSMQAKLLRVLQEGEFRRVGGTETLHTDARVILATNRNLQEMIRHEKFREDLYYRIRGAQIHIPPLRERSQDIPLLASHFIKTAAAAARKKISGFTPEATELIKKYAWPGNVRQLKNEVERVVAFAQTEWIKPDDLDAEIREFERAPAITKGTLKEREKKIILDALRDHKWNILRTAKSLGLTRNGLYGKMKLHGIKNQS